MMNERSQRSIEGGINIASIDIGSHTARLLVGQRTGPPELFLPIARKRAYIRLAEGFSSQGSDMISPEAVERALTVLEDFAVTAKECDASSICAVSTGVVRRAINNRYLLDLIYDRTGIDVRVISGGKEARLARKGVLHSLDIQGLPSVIFDLGGGSTEFISGDCEIIEFKSIPLGAALLTQRFLGSGPLEEEEIGELVRFTDEMLEEAFIRENYPGRDLLIVGTGGTVTTLTAMLNHIDVMEITPERINGQILKRGEIERLFMHMKSLSAADRLRLPGLDRGRADVILAGVIVVIRILYFFRVRQLMASFSDILEGVLIEYIQGDEDE
ncbi:MAG: hypothetical protein JRJ02_01045 [Deltaproteobacteria bacterium]|nr:hypothetical protein [Deltaproteobacteria bacterium]